MGWSKERVIYDESVYFGSDGEDIAVEDLMAVEGLTEAQVRERFSDSEIFERAMEMRENDLSEELSRLVSFFDGRPRDSKAENQNWGNHVLVSAVVGRWDGASSGVVAYDDLEAALDCSPNWYSHGNVLADCEIVRVWDECGDLHVEGAHHDGRASLVVRQLTNEGERVFGELDYEGDIPEGGITAMGASYMPGDEGRLLLDMFGDPSICDRGRYVEREFGCPTLEYEAEVNGTTHTLSVEPLEGGGFGVMRLVDGMPVGGGFRADTLSEAESRCQRFAEKYLSEPITAPDSRDETVETRGIVR